MQLGAQLASPSPASAHGPAVLVGRNFSNAASPSGRCSCSSACRAAGASWWTGCRRRYFFCSRCRPWRWRWTRSLRFRRPVRAGGGGQWPGLPDPPGGAADSRGRRGHSGRDAGFRPLATAVADGAGRGRRPDLRRAGRRWAVHGLDRRADEKEHREPGIGSRIRAAHGRGGVGGRAGRRWRRTAGRLVVRRCQGAVRRQAAVGAANDGGSARQGVFLCLLGASAGGPVVLSGAFPGRARRLDAAAALPGTARPPLPRRGGHGLLIRPSYHLGPPVRRTLGDRRPGRRSPVAGRTAPATPARSRRALVDGGAGLGRLSAAGGRCRSSVRTLEPLHGDRVGFREAGQWLAKQAGPNEGVFDPFGWAGYYAGRYFRPGEATNTWCSYVVLEEGGNHHSHLVTVPEAEAAARGPIGNGKSWRRAAGRRPRW